MKLSSCPYLPGSLQVLVYAPLDILLERDAQRASRLQRSEKRNFYAKAFVLETYEQLYDEEGKPRHPFDMMIDSTKTSVQDLVQKILDHLS